MAGSWEVLSTRQGELAGAINTPQGIAHKYTSDESDGTIDDGTIENLGGSIMAMDVELDDTDPPTSCTITLKTAAGITLLTSGAITASGRFYPDYGFCPVNGDITIEVSNTGNSKIATVVVHVV